MTEKTDDVKAKDLAAREADIAKREDALAKREAALAETAVDEDLTPTPTQAEIDAAKLGLIGDDRAKYLTRDVKRK